MPLRAILGDSLGCLVRGKRAASAMLTTLIMLINEAPACYRERIGKQTAAWRALDIILLVWPYLSNNMCL